MSSVFVIFGLHNRLRVLSCHICWQRVGSLVGMIREMLFECNELDRKCAPIGML